MKLRRLYMLAGMAALIAVLVSGFFTTGIGGTMAGTKVQAKATATPPSFGSEPDAYKLDKSKNSANVPGTESQDPDALTHPCAGMSATPPYFGVSPLSISYVTGMCNSGYGDIAVWQANGHSYVAQSGFALRMFHIWNVDDPYHPVILKTQSFPSGGSTSKAIFHFKQYSHEYLATAMAGTGTGCGYFIHNVDDPTNPVQVVGNFHGADWCTVHETFVSTDTNGDADYAWLTMSGESGSGLKVVAVTLPDLRQANPVLLETGRYQRPDSTPGASGGIFNHDSNVVGNRVYLGHWAGGAVVFDKETLAHNIQPTPLSVDTIRPSNFWVHHLVPTTDNKFLIIEDEFLNGNTEKIKFYNIENLASPVYAGGIIGGDANSNLSQAHNQIIKNLGPHHDLLLSAFYKAGYRVYDVDTSGATPVITPVAGHQLRAAGASGFGNVWGVDSLPCTVRGVQTTCIYSSDMTYGLVADALGVTPALDPYAPEAPVITSPTEGQDITICAISITGTASDYWSGLNRVEVSTDNGGTWNLATGTTSWTYQWNNPSPGAHVLKARAYDMADNMTISALINVTVSANCPFTTPTALPTHTMTAVPTFTPQPPTSTSTATNTAVVPTATNTAIAPTATETAVAPTATNTAIAPTETSVVPTATPITCDMIVTDVPPGSTFYDYIHCVYCRGIMTGYPDGTWRPNNVITRGQIAKVVALSAGYTDVITEQTFEDVAVGSTFFTWIGQLEMHGVISGYSCGGAGEPCGSGNLPYYRPNNSATRGQMTKIIVVASEMPINTTGGPHFNDVASGSTFYDYVETMANAGAIGGYPDGSFQPNREVSRGQAAKMIVLIFFPQCVGR